MTTAAGTFLLLASWAAVCGLAAYYATWRDRP